MNDDPKKPATRLTRDIPDTQKKILFTLSGNRCAFPGCQKQLVEIPQDSHDTATVIGEIAHIVAHGERGPRADPAYPNEKLNSHENLILLCPTCHTKIDRLPYQYNVHVLRQMKRDHESVFMSAEKAASSKLHLKDRIFASAMPITNVPTKVFYAATTYRKQNIKDLLMALQVPSDRLEILAFELRDGQMYAFHDLSENDGPFSKVCDPKSTERLQADEMWTDSDARRIYVSLLNRALTRFLGAKGVRYQNQHHRYYFLADKESVSRSLEYESLGGRRENRMVVWNPITKLTGKPKRRWIHLAVHLSFQLPAKAKWLLAIRPERYITKDGTTEFDPEKIGPVVTRLKASMHNRAYFGEVHFWKQFLCERKPMLALAFGGQYLVLENDLINADIAWAGVPDDDKKVVDLQPDEDLFSLAERRSVSDELDVDDSDEEDVDDI
jgi:hypothetical protein